MANTFVMPRKGGMPLFQLKGQTGQYANQIFPMASGQYTVGRSADNAIHLNEPTISNHHAVIGVEANGIWINDLGSSNETMINGQTIAAATWLKIGDNIQIGPANGFVVQAWGVETPTMMAPPPIAQATHQPPPQAVMPVYQPQPQAPARRRPNWPAIGMALFAVVVVIVVIMILLWFLLPDITITL